MAEFFAYGPLADPDVIAAVTGKQNGEIKMQQATLDGFALGIQKVGNIPDKVMPGMPMSPRKLIRQNWGEDFEMYVVVPEFGETVKGVVFELDEADVEAVRDWELVDLGWYSIVRGMARPNGAPGRRVHTIAVIGQNVSRWVDGEEYDPFLGRGPEFKALFIEHVEAARKQYLQRLAANASKEGASKQIGPTHSAKKQT